MQTDVSPHARIGRNVVIGRYVCIHDNVEIGDNVEVGDFCVLGERAPGNCSYPPLVIGANSRVRSHSILYEGSSFGHHLSVGHHSLIREGVIAGSYLQVGSFSDLEGDATIGEWCCLHSNVHIGRGSVIGSLVWIFPNVVLTNDPLPPSGLAEGSCIDDGVVICTNSVVLPGARIGKGAFVCAGAHAKGVIPEAAVVAGPNSKVVGRIDQLTHAPSGKRHPWMNHYRSKYPAEALGAIEALGRRLQDVLGVGQNQLAPMPSSRTS